MIKKASISDAEKFFELIKTEFPYLKFTLADFRKKFNSENFLFFKFEERNQMKGFFELELINSFTARINSIIVLPEFRRKGIGTKLTEKIIELAGEKEVNELILAVDKKNEAAKTLYEKFGFIESGTEKVAGIEAYRMILVLKTESMIQ